MEPKFEVVVKRKGRESLNWFRNEVKKEDSCEKGYTRHTQVKENKVRCESDWR